MLEYKCTKCKAILCEVEDIKTDTEGLRDELFGKVMTKQRGI